MAIIILYVVVVAGFISRAFNGEYVSMFHNIITFGGLAVLALCESIMRGGKK